MCSRWRCSSASITAQNSKPINSHACTATRFSTSSSGSAALTARAISLTADIHDRSDVGTRDTLTSSNHPQLAARRQDRLSRAFPASTAGTAHTAPGDQPWTVQGGPRPGGAPEARPGPYSSTCPAGSRRGSQPRDGSWWPTASGTYLCLLARVRCGNEFQDASRGQVLLVDPHAEG